MVGKMQETLLERAGVGSRQGEAVYIRTEVRIKRRKKKAEAANALHSKGEDRR